MALPRLRGLLLADGPVWAPSRRDAPGARALSALLRCVEHGYTLKEKCPACGKATSQVGPAKYSPEDRFGSYRRKLKALDRERSAQRSGADRSLPR